MTMKSCIVASIVLALIFLSCNIFDSKNNDHPDNNAMGIIFFDNIDNLSFPLDDAKIDSVGLKDDNIQLKVSYSGGCETHVFRLYVWREFSKSDPPQAKIFLSHADHNDKCEAYITEAIEFDLSELKKYAGTKFQSPGVLLLRIYAPNAREPYYPLPEFYF